MAGEQAHHKIVIIGGGTAGIRVAARMLRGGETDVAVIDPAEVHYYQPLWTLVGGGLTPAGESARAAAAASPGGYVQIDKNTMRHTRYSNIFNLGDAGSSPNSKTGAAIRKQAPVVARNLAAVMAGREPAAGYDGYASCPHAQGAGPDQAAGRGRKAGADA